MLSVRMPVAAWLRVWVPALPAAWIPGKSGLGTTQQRQFTLFKPGPAARRQAGRQNVAADCNAVQSLDPIAGGGDHTFDLVIAALGNGELQQMTIEAPAVAREHGFGRVAQHHPSRQRRKLLVVQRMFGGGLI